MPLTGLNLTVNAAITATDSPLSALGKLQKQISDAATNLAGNVRATELTGFVTGSNASVVNTDSVLVAFGKVQAQMNAKQTSHANLTALSGLAGVADRLPYFTGAGALSLTTLTGLARNLLDDTTQSEMQSTLGLVKQTNVDDLTPGRMVLTGSVRHRVSAGVSSTHRDRLILLHPLYQSTLLPYSIVDGKFTATRGDRAASLNQTIAEVVSSSAYDAHATSLYDLGGNPADPWQAVSCTYQGVKYAALIVPYHVSGYGNGIFFEGRAVSDDANLLLCIEYYNRETSTVLNSEVYDSIAPLPVRKTLRVGGETVYHTGNILGTVSQSGGVPTGAIIERGSNANGEYVRYADGTQICWGRLTFAGSWRVTTNFVSSTAGDMYFANVSVTHPAVFATAPVSVPAVATGPAWGVRGLSSKTTTSSFQVYSGSAATVEIAFLTVGRWL
ncbi:MAG: hypothetical protein B7X50_11750 [Alishewanella sp. 34-51-39]|nr:MAG: hypothetical protein B7X50_11750 [Alishewanella sp. 34-51-39]